ncbi:hypothetical protein NE237_031455 [Protea cynaroides]|uniref:Uncharacterized protein n=1 Tax=Protea cynaroides TaxID=273540 RepID=A0A9Q0L175_9MAGN|nr:hypothetical protein NE237_031455 [Protea cynaroides]
MKYGLDHEDMNFGNPSSSQDCNKRSQSHAQIVPPDMNQVFPEGSKGTWLQKQWMQSGLLQLEEQKLQIQVQMLDLEKQRFKWQRFSRKKDRELDKLRMENEKMKLENERMSLDLKRSLARMIDRSLPCLPNLTSYESSNALRSLRLGKYTE